MLFVLSLLVSSSCVNEKFRFNFDPPQPKKLPSLSAEVLTSPVVIGTSKNILVTISPNDSEKLYSPRVSLPAHLAFEGGSFPGASGTCGKLITSSCTLSLVFSPQTNSFTESVISISWSGKTQSLSLNLRGTFPIQSMTHGMSYNYCALTAEGQVKCWGDIGNQQIGFSASGANRGDEVGEMGDSLPPFYLAATTLTPLSIKSAPGAKHTCALFVGGKLKCFGLNGLGQLGLGDSINRFDIDQMGTTLPFIDLGDDFSVSDFSVGANFTCALSTTGKVKCWGDNSFGQLGLGDTTIRGFKSAQMGNALPYVDLGLGSIVTAIASSSTASCAILNTGAVKCWGNNALGQLGLGDTLPRGDGAGEMGASLTTIDLGTGLLASKVFSGVNFFCIILQTSSSVKCWGANNSGQLGLGDALNRGDDPGEMGNALPVVDLGTGFTTVKLYMASVSICALSVSQVIKCWGGSSAGQLGKGNTNALGNGPGEMGDSLLAVDLGTGFLVEELSVNGASFCARSTSNLIKCWGFNFFGQLGLEDTANRGDGAGEMGDALASLNIGTSVIASALVGNSSMNCALLSTNAIKCWGESRGTITGVSSYVGSSQATIGSNLAPIDLGTGLTFTKVVVGRYHACALTNSNQVKCWGTNDKGQLGLGDLVNRVTNLGDSLPFVALPTADIIVDIQAGESRTCILTTLGVVRCWGYGTGGIGLGNLNVVGDAPSEMGESLAAIDLGASRTANKIMVAHSHSCAILDNDTVKCWGRNAEGQLGIGSTSAKGDGAGEMGDLLPVVDLGTGEKASEIVGGYYFTCALLQSGTTKCWGQNSVGQLGVGDALARGDGAGEMGDSLPVVDLGDNFTTIAIESGAYHSCAVSDLGKVKCWGQNGFQGLLGVGVTGVYNIGDGAGEMGNNLAFANLGSGAVTDLYLGAYQTCFGFSDQGVKCTGGTGNGEGNLTGTTSPYGASPDFLGDNVPYLSF